MTRDTLIRLCVRGEMGAEPELLEVCSQQPTLLRTSSQNKLSMFSRGDGYSPTFDQQ